MRRIVIFTAVLFLAACTRETPVAQTENVEDAGGGGAAGEVVVRSFQVTPEQARRGEAVVANVELAAPQPSRELTVSWYKPDGWLLGYGTQSATPARITFSPPDNQLTEAGEYRAALRSGPMILAEDLFTIAE